MTEGAQRMTRPRVCVVIPTRNRHNSLRNALESVFAQDVEVEVVIVDEASAPPIADVLHPDRRMRIVRNDSPLGPAGARNLGASLARADFIAFLDDDDVWLPGKLVACLACFGEHSEAGMVFHKTVPHGSKQGGAGACQLVLDPLGRMLTQQPPHLDSVLIQREVHENILFDENFTAAAELDYLIRVAEQTPIVELDAVLAMHGPSETSYINIEDRINARLQLKVKHAQLFAEPRAAAFYSVRLGHLYRRAGKRIRSFSCFVRALTLRPGSALAWRGLARSLLPQALADWLSRVGKTRYYE